VTSSSETALGLVSLPLCVVEFPADCDVVGVAMVTGRKCAPPTSLAVVAERRPSVDSIGVCSLDANSSLRCTGTYFV
jgi:hypothetical protein